MSSLNHYCCYVFRYPSSHYSQVQYMNGINLRVCIYTYTYTLICMCIYLFIVGCNYKFYIILPLVGILYMAVIGCGGQEPPHTDPSLQKDTPEIEDTRLWDNPSKACNGPHSGLNMEVSSTQGHEYRPQYTMIQITRTPKTGAPTWKYEELTLSRVPSLN